MQTAPPTKIRGIPSRRIGDTFASFDARHGNGMRQAVAQAKRVATGDAWCCFMVGVSETGKTHLAIAAMNEFHDGGLDRAIFWTVPDFLEWLRVRRYGEDHKERTIMQLAEAYLEQDILLVLDDLGVENPTDWAYEQMYRVLNARRDNQLPTIVTSNLAPKDVDPRILARLKSGLVVCRKTEAKA